MARDRILQEAANFLHCKSICMASSLVGARTNTTGPSPGFNRHMLLLAIYYLNDILIVNMHNSRQHEGKGFTRTCLSNTNHISSRESNRPALTLNACWLFKVLLGKSFRNVLGETCLIKCCDGSWDVLSLDCHLVVNSELGHI